MNRISVRFPGRGADTEVGRAVARTAYPSVAAVGIGALALLEPNNHRDAVLRETVAGTAKPIAVLGGNMVPAAGGETACAGTGGIVPTFRLTQTTAGSEISDEVVGEPAEAEPVQAEPARSAGP